MLNIHIIKGEFLLSVTTHPYQNKWIPLSCFFIIFMNHINLNCFVLCVRWTYKITKTLHANIKLDFSMKIGKLNQHTLWSWLHRFSLLVVIQEEWINEKVIVCKTCIQEINYNNIALELKLRNALLLLFIKWSLKLYCSLRQWIWKRFCSKCRGLFSRNVSDFKWFLVNLADFQWILVISRRS